MLRNIAGLAAGWSQQPGGTLSILIPPSLILMILRDHRPACPVIRLFMAAVVPGVLLTLFYVAIVFVGRAFLEAAPAIPIACARPRVSSSASGTCRSSSPSPSAASGSLVLADQAAKRSVPSARCSSACGGGRFRRRQHPRQSRQTARITREHRPHRDQLDHLLLFHWCRPRSLRAVGWIGTGTIADGGDGAPGGGLRPARLLPRRHRRQSTLVTVPMLPAARRRQRLRSDHSSASCW